MSIFESNYTRIAKKTAKYYFELKRNYTERFKNEVSMLATAGALDAGVYVFLDQSIAASTLLHLAKISLKKPLDIKSRKNIGLTSFIYLLEVEIFSIDTKLHHIDILDTVKRQLGKIEKAVLQTQYENEKDAQIESDVHKFMTMEEFKPYRRDLGVKEIE